VSKPKRLPGWLIDLPVVVLALVLFVGLTSLQLELPGVHTDEALEVLPGMELVKGQEVECFKGACLNIFGLRLPVMIYEYIATVNTYMAIPFFALFGVSVPVLRAMPIAQSAVAMVFLYLLALELYNRRTAILAVSLLAVSPSFVFWSRQGVFVTSVTIPISVMGAWSLLRWWKRGRACYLYLGAFLFGLGVSAKLLFAWLLAGVGGAFLLLNADRFVASVRRRSLEPTGIRLRWRDGAIAVGLFVLGLAPVIIFNIQTMSTIDYVLANLSGASYYEVDNAKIAENLRERIKQLRSVINGETFWYLAIHPYASWRYPSVFLIAIGIGTFALFGGKRQTRSQTWFSCLTVAAVVVPCYVALRLYLPLHELRWRYWFPAISVLSTLTTGVIGLRKHSWRDWVGHLSTGLGAGLFFMLFVYLAWKLAQWFVDWKLYAIAVVVLCLAPLLRAREEARRALFPVLVVAVMIAASVKTPTALWFTHLAILTPWPILSIAAVTDMVAKTSGLDRLNLRRLTPFSEQVGARAASLGTAFVLAVGLMLAYDDLQVDQAYHADLARIGGKGDHTNASYRLADFLTEAQASDVVAMDYGIQDTIQFLTVGEIKPAEIFGYEDWQNVDPAFAIRVREYLDDADAFYVFHQQPHFLNRREAFETIVEQEGKHLVEEAVIYDWSARPIYRVVRVLP
jgi:hypothetical protein